MRAVNTVSATVAVERAGALIDAAVASVGRVLSIVEGAAAVPPVYESAAGVASPEGNPSPASSTKHRQKLDNTCPTGESLAPALDGSAPGASNAG